MADDVPVPPEAVAWVECEAREYFESGGIQLPQIMGGFEGAEIHSFYELKQKRVEHQGMDDMLDALSSALFKTTGDETFKTAEKPPAAEEEPEWGTMKRERYEPTYKYKVPQLGDIDSSTRVRAAVARRPRHATRRATLSLRLMDACARKKDVAARRPHRRPAGCEWQDDNDCM